MNLYTVPRAQQKVALVIIIITYYSALHGSGREVEQRWRREEGLEVWVTRGHLPSLWDMSVSGA